MDQGSRTSCCCQSLLLILHQQPILKGLDVTRTFSNSRKSRKKLSRGIDTQKLLPDLRGNFPKDKRESEKNDYSQQNLTSEVHESSLLLILRSFVICFASRTVLHQHCHRFHWSEGLDKEHIPFSKCGNGHRKALLDHHHRAKQQSLHHKFITIFWPTSSCHRWPSVSTVARHGVGGGVCPC